MLKIFEYPIMISVEDILNNFSLEESFEEIRLILQDAHKHIYDFLIYPTFNQSIKDRVIEKYRTTLEIPLQKALVAQFNYLRANGGNIGEFGGLLFNGQTVDVKESQDIITKIISPEVINILQGATINLLYAGG